MEMWDEEEQMNELEEIMKEEEKSGPDSGC
jgi:hypothetical protein